MTVTPPYTEPKRITLGEQLHWRKSLDDYSSTLYTLDYRFRGNTGKGFDVTATAYNSDFDVVVPATSTQTMAAEMYSWQAWLTEIADSNNTFLVEQGSAIAEVGFEASQSSPVDLRTTNEQILAALQATIKGKATKDQLSYKIESGNGSREIRRMTWTELLAAESHYQNLVAREQHTKAVRNGRPFFKNYHIHSREA